MQWIIKTWKLDRMASIQLIVYALLVENTTVLGSCQFFDERILQQRFFYTMNFLVDVRQIIQKFILRQIFNVCACISFIKKGVSIVQKLHV